MEKFYIPLANGVGLYDKNKLCVAIVDDYGNKRVGGRDINPKSKIWDKPFFRGIGYFIFYLTFLVMSISKADELNEQGNKNGERIKKINSYSWLLGVISCLLFAFLIGLSVFGILPRFILEKIVIKENWIYNFLLALFRCGLFYIILVLFKFIPAFSSLYAFNRQTCERGRGGLREISPFNFLNLMINTFLFSLFVISLINLKINIFADFFINLSIFALILTIFYEILRFYSNSKSNFVREICLITNFLVLAKTGLTQKEVVLVAELEINKDGFINETKDAISMSCVFAEMKSKLLLQDKYEPSDVEWIVATVLDKNRTEIKLIRNVSEKEYREIMRATERRAKGEPLSSIFGFVDFYGLRFIVNKKVLSPRMETEILVEEGLKKIKQHQFKNALDLCTGSGAIGVCLAKFGGVNVTAIDISKQALAIAEENSIKNGVKIEFLQSNLFNELKKKRKYDIIISNPPYIKSEDILSLDEEVKRYDPRIALDGGEDGLEFYRNIIKDAPQHLNQGGYLMFEMGINQVDDIKALMQEGGFQGIEIVKDYNKIERIIYGRIC